MKAILNILAVVLLGASLAACPLDKNSELAKHLGPYQYQGMDPELSFTILKAEFGVTNETGITVPTINYTINIKQNNAEFPLKIYRVSALASILDNNGNEIGTFSVYGVMQDGVLSVSEIQSLYSGSAAIKSFRPSDLRVKMKSYTWYPKVEFKPYGQESKSAA